MWVGQNQNHPKPYPSLLSLSLQPFGLPVLPLFRLLRLLLRRPDCAIDAVDRRGQSALHLAAELGHVEMVRALLEAGAQKEPDDGFGLESVFFVTFFCGVCAMCGGWFGFSASCGCVLIHVLQKRKRSSVKSPQEILGNSGCLPTPSRGNDPWASRFGKQDTGARFREVSLYSTTSTRLYRCFLVSWFWSFQLRKGAGSFREIPFNRLESPRHQV